MSRDIRSLAVSAWLSIALALGVAGCGDSASEGPDSGGEPGDPTVFDALPPCLLYTSPSPRDL